MNSNINDISNHRSMVTSNFSEETIDVSLRHNWNNHLVSSQVNEPPQVSTKIEPQKALRIYQNNNINGRVVLIDYSSLYHDLDGAPEPNYPLQTDRIDHNLPSLLQAASIHRQSQLGNIIQYKNRTIPLEDLNANPQYYYTVAASGPAGVNLHTTHLLGLIGQIEGFVCLPSISPMCLTALTLCDMDILILTM